MSERDTPAGTADERPAATFDDGVAGIADLLEPPADKADTGTEAAETTDSEAEPPADRPEEADTGADETQTLADDANTDEAREDSDDTDDDETAADTGPATASDEAMVQLADGSEITVHELKRGHLRQQDYTRKAQTLSDERKRFEENRAIVTEQARKLVEQRDLLLELAPLVMPAEPDPSSANDDPVGYMQAKAAFDAQMVKVNRLAAARREALEQDARTRATEAEKLRKAEAEKLFAAMPELKDRQAYARFWGEANDVMVSHYGFTPEELEQASDHRMYRVMADAMAWRRAKAKARAKPPVHEARPPMAGQKRTDPRERAAGQARERAQRARKDGSLESAVASLMDFDL